MAWIEAEIAARGGAVTFRDYMELALYHPEHGYYSAAEPRYGREGDFLTAPTASPWYARLIARLLRGLAAVSGKLAVVDVAAGDGAFLRAFVAALEGNLEDVTAGLWGVERSPAMRGRAAVSVPEARLVTSVGDLPSSLPRPVAVHACELYDALPVHRVVGTAQDAVEQWVVARGGGLRIVTQPLSPEVRSYLDSHRVELLEDQIAELNLDGRRLHRELLEKAGEGIAVVLDYGYETRRLYNPRGRFAGSLATFRRHRVGRDPLETPGEVDLTAHVNWDDLRLAAADAGWREVGLFPLAELLVRAGLAAELEERGLGPEADLDAATVSARQEIKRLLDPEGMGSDLKVLVQARGDLAEVAGRLLRR